MARKSSLLVLALYAGFAVSPLYAQQQQPRLDDSEQVANENADSSPNTTESGQNQASDNERTGGERRQSGDQSAGSEDELVDDRNEAVNLYGHSGSRTEGSGLDDPHGTSAESDNSLADILNGGDDDSGS